MASSSDANKRGATSDEPIDLGSTDEDEPRDATSAPSLPVRKQARMSLPAGASELRGVKVPPGWAVHGGSLLVRAFGDPQPSATVAAFDFDGCLADTPLGGNDPKAWKMQYAHVPTVLADLHSSGHAIVIITNESMDRFKKPEAIRGCVLKKTGRLEAFAAACNVPMLTLCPTAKDTYRKPAAGSWQFFTASCNGGLAVDSEKSFFVGDAAGRPGDHSDADIAFARAAGLPFHDEKSFFERLHPPK